MKRFFISLLFCLVSLPITAGVNSRVTRVIDSRTLLLDNGATVTLRGVDVAPADEAAATEYLRNVIGTAPVFVENGDVYRSPDALYVNGQMAQRAWQSAHPERYLGMADPSGKTFKDPTPRPPAPRRSVPQRHHYPRVRLRAARK